MTAKTSNTVKFVQPAAKRYARVLYELEIPKADIEKTKEIFCQVPEVYEVLLNPVITAKNKYSVIEQIFPRSEERRVGKECLRLCRSRWSPYH